MTDDDDIDIAATACFGFMLGAWRLERQRGNPKAMAAVTEEDFFGFKPADILCLKFFKHGHVITEENVGTHWFVLKDGRVFSSRGEPSESDLQLYDDKVPVN